MNIYKLSILTFTIMYAAIAFVMWDITWIDFLTTASPGERTWFFGGLILKVGSDFWLKSLIADYKERKNKKDVAIIDIENK